MTNEIIEVIEGQVVESGDPRADKINQEYELFKSDLQSGMLHALRCGDLLLEVKASLPHGHFQAWVNANIQFTYEHCRRFMRLAEAKNTRVCVLDMDKSIRENLRLLADVKKKSIVQKVIDWAQDKLSKKQFDELDGIFKRVMVAKAHRDNQQNTKYYLQMIREKCMRIINFIDNN